ncbi:MAG TPA: PRC-barrel domain-containing protein [Gaiellaceae bacterium]|nr:PRC-barrel domain-containing protein [Gaiellaceae bacterium]
MRAVSKSLESLRPRRLLSLATSDRDDGPSERPSSGLTGWPAPTVNRPGEDPELEYWLANCEGFLVDTESNEEVGVVDEVEMDPDSGRAVTLLVSCGWFGHRRLRVPARDVVAISPGARALIVKTAAL